MPYRDEEKRKACWKRYQRSEKSKIKRQEWTKENREKLNAQQRARNATEKYKRYFLSRHLLKTYGITDLQYHQMVVDQGGCCAICGKAPGYTSHVDSRLHVDHCHGTNRVRGLLCTGCNKGLGQFGESIERMEAAIAYLRSWSEKLK